MNINILEQLKEGIAVIDKNYKIKYCNSSLLNYLGYKKEQLIEESIDKIVVLLKDDNACFEERKDGNWQLININDELCDVKAKVVIDEWNNESAYWLIISEYRPYTVETLEKILENLPYGIWINKFRGEYKYINQNFINMNNRTTNRNTTIKDYINRKTNQIWRDVIWDYDMSNDDDVLEKTGIINEERQITDQFGGIKYTLIKIPVYNEMQEIEYVIGIVRYAIHQSDVDRILLNDLRNNYEPRTKIVERFKENTVKQLGVESILICEYNQESNRLKGLYRINNLPNEVLNQVDIFITKQEMERIANSKIEWKIEEFCQFMHIPVRKDLIDQGIGYIYIYPIIYNGEIMGMLIACYKSRPLYSTMERRILDNLCGYAASTIKNNKLSRSLRKELVRRLQVEHELKMFLEVATDFICINDENGDFVDGNLEWWENLGWQPHELVRETAYGKRRILYTELLVDEDKEITQNALDEMLKNQKGGNVTNRWKCKNGGYRWLRWEVKYSSKEKYFYTVAKDITELIEMKNKQLMYKETIALENLKNEFLANISHELKTPINLMYSTLQLIDNEKIASTNERNAERLERYRGIVRQNIFRLIRLVNNVTDISKISAGSGDRKKGNYDIIEIIENISMSAVEYMNRKDLEFIFDTQVEEVVVACNPDMIERIMLNLLSNAIKYTERGSVFINVDIVDQKLCVTVTDTGIGIPQEKIDIIFEPFVQVDTSFTRRCEGSGIGLALVKVFVEAHDGQVYVESEVGRGSKFTVEIPIRVIEGEEVSECPISEAGCDKSKVEFSDIY